MQHFMIEPDIVIVKLAIIMIVTLLFGFKQNTYSVVVSHILGENNLTVIQE